MRAARIRINNFRGIKQATLILPKHGVLIGDNNTGKTTILEALDLVLGPDRLNRRPPIDEHDFFRGFYTLSPDVAMGEDEAEVANDDAPNPLTDEAESTEEAPRIEIEVTVADLTEEQKGTFADYIEFWDSVTDKLYDAPDPAGVDAANITEALRITFHGWYDEEEDDFEGKTYFTRSLTESDRPDLFSRRHKQVCGFLYLRSHRTGTRALSLERGSLLDIILRLKEVRPQMWEAALGTLSDIPVASDPNLGISPVLESINTVLKKYVPKEWGVEPHLKVSNLTREHLRKVITAFIATGEGKHAAPFYRQGTGTINMLVLAMLSQIAEDKQNVIFAMEEPETAIPPYAQKRIVHEVRDLASQTLFTSHSPYVLEEFTIEETMVLARDADGILTRKPINLPDNVKLKRYRQEFRTRFCEGLLARRVLVAEGATEASAFPVACRRLAELRSDTYSSLEALGICVVDADGESNIPGVAQLYRELGKNTFAICDKQEADNKSLIQAQIELLLMHGEKGFEDMVLKGASESALKRFANQIDWPQHLAQKYPELEDQAEEALADYFARSKANWGIADFLAQCSEDEMPDWLKSACQKISYYCTLDIEGFRLLWGDPVTDDEDDAPAGAGSNPEDGTDGSD
ncbi:ATP-dependent nuclease [Litchfieldella xinjiangensis]|uniref:ATP-dependent nuclease n=1 Tax=Litchfieldella xinjiangensis TaxID=1166948 RepID=UPI0009E02B2B|nr:ATP-binding protein [Halomonas xinjiangensis]